MRWWGMLWLLLVLAGAATAADPPVPTTAETDSLKTPPTSYWGPLPARTDSTTTRLQNPPTRAWEHVVDAPYNLVGIPFRLGNVVIRETVKKMDSWGLFDLPPVPEPGLPLPFGFLLLPDGGYSSLRGWEFGANIRHPAFLGVGNKAYLNLETSTRHADKIGGGFHFVLGDHYCLELGGGGADIPLARYFGRGHDSSEENESYYNRIARWVGWDLTRELGRVTHTRLRVFYSHLDVRDSGYNTEAALRIVHADDLPAGFPGKSSGVTAQVDWFFDTAVIDGRPNRGTFKRAAVAYFQATDGSDLDYLQYTFDFQRFLPLWHTKRVLGLRAYGSRILPGGGTPVPLSRLISTYRPYSLRGLESHRYYGLGNLGLSAEYRWPIWVAKGRSQTGLDAYLFTDTGQVYEHATEISLEHFIWTYGGGLRLMGSEDNFSANVEMGFSEEGFQLQIGFSQAFQFSGKGLMYGKDPTHRP